MEAQKQNSAKFKRRPIVHTLLLLVAVGASVAYFAPRISANVASFAPRIGGGNSSSWEEHGNRFPDCHFAQATGDLGGENGTDLLGNTFKGSSRCTPVCVWVPSGFGDTIINVDEIHFFPFIVFDYPSGYPEMYLFDFYNTFFNPDPDGLPIRIGEANIINRFSFGDEIAEVHGSSQGCSALDKELKTITAKS